MRLYRIFTFFSAILFLVSCRNLDLLTYGVQGKNVQLMDLYGDTEVDVEALDKIVLKGFSIQDFQNPLVAYHIKQYQTSYGKKTLENIFSRASIYLPTILRIFKEKGIPEELAYLPIIESSFYPQAVSHAGAAGLWQFMVGTGRMYDLKQNWWYDDRMDIYKSTEAAAYHLKYLYKRFDNWLLVLAAYNAGGGKVSRLQKKYNTDSFWTISKYNDLRKETKNYVPKFIATTIIARNPEKYGFPPLNLHDELSLKSFKVNDATDLQVLSQCANMTVKEFKAWNPSIKRWATPPAQAHNVYIPMTNYNTFVSNFTAIPDDQRVTFRRYRVRMGDNLSRIGSLFQVPINPIAQINKFKSIHSIEAGETIVIPIKGLENARASGSATPTKNKNTDQRAFLHEVKENQTLYEIALKYNVSLEDLFTWNQLASKYSIYAGKFLILYDTEVVEGSHAEN